MGMTAPHDNEPRVNIIDRFWISCSRTVASTVVRGTEERPTFEYLTRFLLLGRCFAVVAISFGATFRIFGSAASFGRVFWMALLIPIISPFPNIANHIVEAIAIGG